MTEYLIIGAGVAGRRAAEVIRRKDQDAQITVIDEGPDPFYYKPLLGTSLFKGANYVRLANAQKQALSAKGIRLLTRVKATSIDTFNRTVSLGEKGSTLSYDKLLIACGRKTVRPPWVDGVSAGVAYFDSLEDVSSIARMLGKIRTAVVCGPGIQAMDALRGLRGCGIDCVYIVDGGAVWPGILDTPASEIIEARLRQEGIAIVYDSPIERLDREGGSVRAVVTANGERIPADLVVIAGSQTALHECIRSTDLAVGQGLVVDRYLRTTKEDVFAAGDSAEPLCAGATTHCPQPGWLPAWKQGNIAGTNMVGGSAEYVGIPSVRTKIFDLDVISMGTIEANEEGMREDSGGYPYPELPYVYKKIVYRNQRLVGALLVGDVSEASQLERLILAGTPVGQADQQLMDHMFNIRLPTVSAVGALCPVCKFQIQVDDSHKEGDIVTCPACGIEFRLTRLPNGVFGAEPLRG